LNVEHDEAQGTLGHDEDLLVRLTDEPIAHGYQIRCELALTPALGLGLAVRPRAGLLRVTDEPEPNLGWEFHDYYVMDAFDRRRAVDLLKGEPSRELTALTRFGRVELTDTVLLLRIRVIDSNHVEKRGATEIAGLVRRAHALASSLRARRAMLRPCETEQYHLRVLQRAAVELGGRVDSAARRLCAERPSGTLRVWIERVSGAQWSTHLTLELARPAAAAFRLTDEAERSTWDRWTDPDIQLEDAEFDRAFVVRSDEPAATRQCLVPTARAALLDLRKRVRHLIVDDTHIAVSVDEALRDVVVIATLTSALERAAAALSSPDRPRASAYR